ncbi:MAG: spore germination protein [Bacillota bacterium]
MIYSPDKNCSVFHCQTFPRFFIALTTFHPQLIPITFLMAILDNRRTPFPALIVVLIMIFFFELLHEVGFRLPSPVGSVVSTVEI